MPSTPKKSGPQAYPVELSLQPLKNCLVNLPTPLASILVHANTPAQNVIVELVQRQSSTSSPSAKQNAKPPQRSIYVGWTGMSSRRKLGSLVGNDGSESRRGGATRREQEVPLVEIDSAFAKLLGLSDGQKVGVLLHRDPPTIHTVNIEPLTPIDWEIIELHANFLEINLLSQIRALPNPLYKLTNSATGHPLTLHLSPTSTANVVVTSLTPQPSPTAPFVKISPDAEVIVAPKSRSKVDTGGTKDIRSIQSPDARSSTSTAKARSRRSEVPARRPLFLRGINRQVADGYFDEGGEADEDNGIEVWVDWTIRASDMMRSVSHVLVSVVHPAGLRAPIDPQKQGQQGSHEGSEAFKPATSIIAGLCAWEEALDDRHIVLSTSLCTMLQLSNAVGDTIRIEIAPAPVVHGSLKAIRITPLLRDGVTTAGFQFGGKSRNDREEAAKKVFDLYRKRKGGQALLEGPLTDGMLLPAVTPEEKFVWGGGILRFDPVQGSHIDKAKSTRGWFLGTARKMAVRIASDSLGQSFSSELSVDISGEANIPETDFSDWVAGEALPPVVPALVGVDKLLLSLAGHIRHGSSLLLTGTHGSGKTSITHMLANRFQREFFNITYFSCRSLVTDETRVSTIKGQLNRVFGLAAWRARGGGRSLVILDDLDKLCPVETELEVGNDNGRSRHVSEVVVSLAKHYCSQDSGVVLVATAKGKDEVNNVIIGGHMVREFVHLSSPDKETRRTILEYLTKNQAPAEPSSTHENISLKKGQEHEMDTRSSDSRQPVEGFHIDPAIDFLDIAGQTDGHMPGDLQLVVSRARSEALIRTVSNAERSFEVVELTATDFSSALKGFTPSSLLNVTLQRSSTTFASIGGLRETRQILLETLQYPTLYAPIFARCPLRLRSGLLLYGYPGCGKTLLASAVAGECGLNFISVKGPEILNKYIGASEKAVRDLFERAQAARPCVLFFDEFDSVAPKRGHDSTGVTDRVVNQLLTQMDGAEGLSGVYVLAATSRPDLIDPALLRPGRLDKSLLCDMPDFEDRLDILQAMCKKLKVSAALISMDEQVDGSDEVDENKRDLREVARRTRGYSGADLQAVVYNAHLEAIHDVLGDSGRMSKPSKTATSDNSGSTLDSMPDFTYFRLGKDADDEDAPLSAAGKASERAKIAAQLAAYRRAAQQTQRSGVTDSGSRNKQGAKEENKEPTIEWQHIERSLAQTRASISDTERNKLTRIYREFVVGRSGEMPSGEGSTEVGGRTSLM